MLLNFLCVTRSQGMGSQAGQCELVTSPKWCPSSSSGEEKPVANLAPTCSRVSGLTKHSTGSFPTPTILLLLQGEFCSSLAMLVNRLKWKGYKSTWTHAWKNQCKTLQLSLPLFWPHSRCHSIWWRLHHPGFLNNYVKKNPPSLPTPITS